MLSLKRYNNSYNFRQLKWKTKKGSFLVPWHPNASDAKKEKLNGKKAQKRILCKFQAKQINMKRKRLKRFQLRQCDKIWFMKISVLILNLCKIYEFVFITFVQVCSATQCSMLDAQNSFQIWLLCAHKLTIISDSHRLSPLNRWIRKINCSDAVVLKVVFFSSYSYYWRKEFYLRSILLALPDKPISLDFCLPYSLQQLGITILQFFFVQINIRVYLLCKLI